MIHSRVQPSRIEAAQGFGGAGATGDQFEDPCGHPEDGILLELCADPDDRVAVGAGDAESGFEVVTGFIAAGHGEGIQSEGREVFSEAMGSILIRFVGEDATEGIAGSDDAEAGRKFGEGHRASQVRLAVGRVLHGPSRRSLAGMRTWFKPSSEISDGWGVHCSQGRSRLPKWP